jgi:hypothetical protein
MHAGTGETADCFRTVPVALLGDHQAELIHQIVVERNCDAVRSLALRLTLVGAFQLAGRAGGAVPDKAIDRLPEYC